MGVRIIFPAMLPLFREAFDLTLTTAGLLISVLWYAYALGQFPGGVLGDRLGARIVLTASTLVSTVTIFLVALAWDYRILFAATALFGFATALYGTTRFTVLTDVYSKRDGTAVSLTMAAGDVGNTLLPPLAVGIASWFSWRAGMGFTAPLFLCMGLFLWYAIPSGSLRASDGDGTSATDGGDAATADGSSPSLRYVLSSILLGPVLIATAIQFLGFFAWQGFTSFFVTYLIETKGFSTGAASTLFGFFFFLGLLVRPLSGLSHDTLGPRRTLMGILTLITIGLSALSFVEGFIPLVVLTVLLSSLLGFTPTTQTFIANALPTEIKGSGLGLLRTGHLLFGATSATIVGFVADIGYFDRAFLLLAGATGVAAVLSLFLPKLD
ncbi:MFS transporter (plasmid) [Natrinema zhouii]|nr:MFS transporter [Natrinema zhouii]